MTRYEIFFPEAKQLLADAVIAVKPIADRRNSGGDQAYALWATFIVDGKEFVVADEIHANVVQDMLHAIARTISNYRDFRAGKPGWLCGKPVNGQAA